jgi:hypothetical protein
MKTNHQMMIEETFFFIVIIIVSVERMNVKNLTHRKCTYDVHVNDRGIISPIAA